MIMMMMNQLMQLECDESDENNEEYKSFCNERKITLFHVLKGKSNFEQDFASNFKPKDQCVPQKIPCKIWYIPVKSQNLR